VCLYGLLVRTVSQPQRPVEAASYFLLPSLVLAILAIVVVYRVCQVSLIFPLHLEVDFLTLVGVSFPPALVLFFASGMALHLNRTLRQQYFYWLRKPFILMSRGLGCSPARALSKLVLLKSMAHTY